MRIKTILPFLAVALCFATCKIDRQDKLVGVWRVVPFTDPDSVTAYTYWTFYAGDVLEVFTVETDSSKVKPGDIVKPHQISPETEMQGTDSVPEITYNRRGTIRRKVEIVTGDTVGYGIYTYSTIGKELTISYEGNSGNDGYIVGSNDLRGTYWFDELKKNKRLKLIKRKHPDGIENRKAGAYMRIELVKN
jgi:hypothetical protein